MTPAGTLFVLIPTQSAILAIVKNARQHTTTLNCPLELFKGGLYHRVEGVLDYGRVDAWSFGSLLFGIFKDIWGGAVSSLGKGLEGQGGGG